MSLTERFVHAHALARESRASSHSRIMLLAAFCPRWSMFRLSIGCLLY